MLLLALDTSTRQSSIALSTEDVLYGEYTWLTGTNHSVELLSNIRRLLTESQLSMQQIEAVAVTIGPGSFTGVRVALATAKALAFALKKPLIGVSTLDVIAAQQQLWRGPVCAVLEAGRSELYASCYLFDETGDTSGALRYSLRRLCDYMVCTPEHLAEYVQEHGGDWCGVPGERQLPHVLFCGEMSPVSRQALLAQQGEKRFFASRLQSSRHASVLALLAQQRVREEALDDPLSLEPLYLRRPSITTSTRKQPLLGGASL